VQELIGFGSVWEDDSSTLQALRHFYNPRNGSGLSAGWISGEPSPSWIIDGSAGNSTYSYMAGRTQFNREKPTDIVVGRTVNIHRKDSFKKEEVPQ
jgi:hypothetical protein